MTTPSTAPPNPVVRYPAGPISPHGAYHLLKGIHPNLKLTSYDESVVLDMMGGRSIPVRNRPESVQIPKDGLKGLIAPWDQVDQKGATEDGVTNVDSLYQPTEIELTALCKGRDAKRTRRVVRTLIDSIDAKQQSELSWFTQEMGRWWTKVRWDKGAPPDPYAGAQHNRQRLSLRLRADDAFWRTYDDVSDFRFTYQAGFEGFTFTTDEDLGDDWTLAYSGDGGGFIRSNGEQAVWVDDPEDPILTEGRSVVCLRDDYASDDDTQVITIELGSFPEWSFPDNAYNDVWGRTPTDTSDGTPGDNGVRLRIGIGWIRLSYFVDGVETVLRQRPLIPPLKGEKFTLVCGYQGDPFLFKVKRNGIDIMSVKDAAGGSHIGADYRGAGFGMHAGAALLTQATPAAVAYWSAGTNVTSTQSGFLKCVNIGDQKCYYRYTLFGPGTFKIALFPGSTEFVEFGPLLPNQVVQLRTDPRKGGLRDLTSVPPTPQQLTDFQEALKDFISFATGNNVPPLLQQIESLFGIKPPQGNMWSLMKGRFTSKGGVPAKPAGGNAQPYYVACSIDGGNADSKILAAGTPLRRYPN